MYSFVLCAFLALVLTTLAPAQALPQDAVPQPPAGQQTPPPAETAPAAAQPSTTPEVVPDAPPVPLPEEFTGPGLLTRGFTVTPLANQNVRFRPFFSLAGIADDGLTGVSTKDGQIANQQGYGIEAGFGISGRRIFRRDTFSLEFRGNLSHYTPNSYYDGGNFFLTLDYEHRFSRRIKLDLQESAGQYSNNYSLINSAADLTVGSTGLVVTPNTELFDNRVLYLSSSADVVFEKSARLSFDFGGTGFLTRRRASSLYGSIGSQARADMAYRATRRTTLGAYYSFTHYDFNRAFGGSFVHTAGLIYSYSISRGLELRLRMGVSRVETQGIQQITLDPVIAEILGTNIGTVAIYNLSYLPDLSAQLSKTFRKGNASLEYVRGVSPGNGLFLTSRRETIGGFYDYTGIRRYTFTAGASRDTLSTLSVAVGKYTSSTVRGGMTRVLTRGFQGDVHAEYRHYDITGAPLLRNSYRITLGVAWTPNEKPLKLW